jgi:hypothetical protein
MSESAQEFTHTACPSIRKSTTGLIGEALSNIGAVGNGFSFFLLVHVF